MYFFSQADFILCLQHGLWKLILQLEAIKKPCLNYLYTICQEHFAKISGVFWSPGEANSTLDKHSTLDKYEEHDLWILGKQHGKCQTATFIMILVITE